MSDERTGEQARPPPPGGGFEEMEARRRRVLIVLAILAVLAVLAAVIVAFVPRTVASGEQDGTSWALRVSPGIVSPTVRLDVEQPTGEPSTAVIDGFATPADLEDTSVLQVPSDGTATTIIVGPTPRGTDSVRITSLERGVGEASIERVAWRRIHVAVISDDVWVTDLVSIARDGGVLDTVRDLPVPGAVVPDGETDPGAGSVDGDDPATGDEPSGTPGSDVPSDDGPDLGSDDGSDEGSDDGTDGAVEVDPEADVEVDPGDDATG